MVLVTKQNSLLFDCKWHIDLEWPERKESITFFSNKRNSLQKWSYIHVNGNNASPFHAGCIYEFVFLRAMGQSPISNPLATVKVVRIDIISTQNDGSLPDSSTLWPVEMSSISVNTKISLTSFGSHRTISQYNEVTILLVPFFILEMTELCTSTQWYGPLTVMRLLRLEGGILNLGNTELPFQVIAFLYHFVLIQNEKPKRVFT